ncbi:putative elongation factor 1-gamma protein [Rosellinia necatrix]|uniref:Putative elongation factor 1-gamma protein n=1 Tax=Rosellinia necatrix TaxID=77044 RepID=A0A1W2THM9_ROSNE|nr:putative elongation factor 1-gamma protein [Rosellinia necatrix]
MAPFGKIFTRELNPRTTAILAVAKANGLELETVEVDAANPSAELLEHNKLGKVPTFVGSDGYSLTETIAISIYITSQNEKTTLLGKTKQDYASILKWMSFFNSEVISSLGAWYRPLLGLDAYNKKNIDEAIKASKKAVAIVEEHLLHNTYLVGERITLADLFATSIISRGFQFFYDAEWRSENPNTTRWYETVYNQPIYLAVSKPLEFLEKPKLVNVPPKKAEQSEYPLDEWKRFYSNNPADQAMEYFWKTVPFKDYSIWQVEYKYNDELRLVFMSNNLIGGFNNRLEGSRKYLFGAASVYGENHDSVISGAFVIRGDEYLPVFDVAPDYESFTFKKLDPENAEDRAIVESRWKFDKPVTVGDKEYKYADGKVFK